MSITKTGSSYFGTCQEDIRTELARYATVNGYEIHHFKDVVCSCGNTTFTLYIDDEECVAGRQCTSCNVQHVMLDGEEYIEDAELYHAVCTCEAEPFEITVGVSLYSTEIGLSEDVRWLYIGCRCPSCNLVGCYADWKNEFNGYQEFLSKA
jgi:hypothetical protein